MRPISTMCLVRRELKRFERSKRNGITAIYVAEGYFKMGLVSDRFGVETRHHFSRRRSHVFTQS